MSMKLLVWHSNPFSWWGRDIHTLSRHTAHENHFSSHRKIGLDGNIVWESTTAAVFIRSRRKSQRRTGSSDRSRELGNCYCRWKGLDGPGSFATVPLWKSNKVQIKPPSICLTLSKYMCIFHYCSLLHFTPPDFMHRLNPFCNNNNNNWSKHFSFSSNNGTCFSCKYSQLGGSCSLVGPEHSGVNLFKCLTSSFTSKGQFYFLVSTSSSSVSIWACWAHRPQEVSSHLFTGLEIPTTFQKTIQVMLIPQ